MLQKRRKQNIKDTQLSYLRSFLQNLTFRTTRDFLMKDNININVFGVANRGCVYYISRYKWNKLFLQK